MREICPEKPISIIWRCDQHGHAVWNSLEKKTVGVATSHAFVENIHPDDLANYSDQQNKAFAGRIPYTTEYRLQLHPIQWRFIRESGLPVYGPEGKFEGYTGTITSLSHNNHPTEIELRVSEQRLKNILDNLPMLISYVDKNHYYRYNNRPYEQYLNKPMDEIEGLHMREVLGEEAYLARLKYIEAACDGETVDFEMSTPDQHGLIRHTMVNYVPDCGSDGVRGIFCVVNDITPLKNAEKELRVSQEQCRAAAEAAQHANHMKDQFLATLSHELRTPLNAILGWAQLIQIKFKPTGQLMEGLECIVRNARIQAQLVADLLDMSGIVSGKLAFKLQRIDFVAVTKTAIATVTPSAAAKEIEIICSVPDGEILVLGDAQRLQQIIWNLLSNSIKFSERKSKIHVSLRIENSIAIAQVEDHGCGISPKFLPLIFDRFRQADSSMTRRVGGLGIGLALGRQLIESHGGAITAHSDGLGHGSTFEISLPCLLADGVATAPTFKAFNPNILAGITVLLVEDEEDSREVISQILQEASADVITAVSAAEGLAYLSANKADIIISDIGLPGMDGLQFMSEIRQTAINKDIPSIALTAFAYAEHHKTTQDAGFQLHLAKPVESDELIRAVADLAGVTQR